MLVARAFRFDSLKDSVRVLISQVSFRSFLDWLSLRDYEDAIKSARIAVIKRYARGNVTFQNGNILDEEALRHLTAKGDKAFAELDAQERASKHGDSAS
jgi:hypothetical protein